MQNKQTLLKQIPSLKNIIKKAQEELNPKRIWVFGSRARGDFRQNSDIDLAFEISLDKEVEWINFKLWVEEEAQTLLSFDLVNFSTAQEKLKKSIFSEGILIYEAN